MGLLTCSYCSLKIDNDDYLNCDRCEGDIHLKCLKNASTPGDLLGDVFFNFTCAKCIEKEYKKTVSRTKSRDFTAVDGIVHEKFVRRHISWLVIIILTIYNLSIKSKGLSHYGFFHWRTHIAHFIDKNWKYLFEKSSRRRKHWLGSISGTLSHNCPKYFTSGQDILNESGWWKLTHSHKTPKFIYKIYETEYLSRQKTRQIKDSTKIDTICNEVNQEENYSGSPLPKDSCSRTIPYMGRNPRLFNKESINLIANTVNNTLMPLNAVQSNLMDFLAENLVNNDMNILPNVTSDSLMIECSFKGDIIPSNVNSTFSDSTSHLSEENNFLQDNRYHTEELATSNKLAQSIDEHLLYERQYSSLKYPIANVASKANTYLAYPTNKNSANYVSYKDGNNKNNNSNWLKNSFNDFSVEDINKVENVYSDNDAPQPRIVQVTNYHLHNGNELDGSTSFNESLTNQKANSMNTKANSIGDTEMLTYNFMENITVYEVKKEDNQVLPLPIKPSLLSKGPRRAWPWLLENDNEESDIDNLREKNLQLENNDLIIISEYEERNLLDKMRKFFLLGNKCHMYIPSFVRRFYRKLCIRECKRQNGKSLFNVDNYSYNFLHNVQNLSKKKSQIYDRYQLISLTSWDMNQSFFARIVGSVQYELFESPYTKRILQPFIYRNIKCFPPYLKFMCELKYKVNGITPTRAPIDFCYIRPNHVAAVNALLQTIFWPGIDMSDCLSYPDFSVIALYKKLIIGCGFLVPDVGYNEAYISFMAVRPGWQRNGIGTFMLYHLIQTCMAKDITLHVSASNPAIVLYQKFGFKIEEIILNFYEKYLPFESRESRHAFFLRMIR